MLGAENTEKLIEKGIIEIAPLAYMRGRTLEDAYVILDEAQNTTDNQMKMFLTRLASILKCITGDITQIDLPKQTTNGLKHAMKILEGVKGISFVYFNSARCCSSSSCCLELLKIRYEQIRLMGF